MSSLTTDWPLSSPPSSKNRIFTSSRREVRSFGRRTGTVQVFFSPGLSEPKRNSRRSRNGLSDSAHARRRCTASAPLFSTVTSSGSSSPATIFLSAPGVSFAASCGCFGEAPGAQSMPSAVMAAEIRSSSSLPLLLDQRLRQLQHLLAVGRRRLEHEVAGEEDLEVLLDLVLRLGVELVVEHVVDAGHVDVEERVVLAVLALDRPRLAGELRVAAFLLQLGLRRRVLLRRVFLQVLQALERLLAVDHVLALRRELLLAGVAEVVVEVGLTHRLARREHVDAVLRHPGGDELDVRDDADLLDRDVARREVLRDRELERRVVGERRRAPAPSPCRSSGAR